MASMKVNCSPGILIALDFIYSEMQPQAVDSTKHHGPITPRILSTQIFWLLSIALSGGKEIGEMKSRYQMILTRSPGREVRSSAGTCRRMGRP
jgi:hypothetical protein